MTAAKATTPEPQGLALLRVPFPPNLVSKLPKPLKRDAPRGRCEECGGWHGLPAIHLDYVGHAALTSRLLDADSSWTWEPLAVNERGLPALDESGGLWIRLTVCGVTRLGYGDAQGKMGGDAMKERIGDALRNAAMRFGAALDLWHKGDLFAREHPGEAGGDRGHDDAPAPPEPDPEPKPVWPDDAFARRMPRFRAALAGGKSAQYLIEWAGQQGSLTAAQEGALRTAAAISEAGDSHALSEAVLRIQIAPEDCRGALSEWAAERAAELRAPQGA